MRYSCSLIFKRLGYEHETLVEPLLKHLITFRDNELYHTSFPCKVELEASIMAAIKSCGFRKFVSIIPLNVESGAPKRPYLLSMFVKCQSFLSPFGTHDISYFASDLAPLASRLLERCAALCASGHEREGKLFETLGVQVWELFSVICASVPADVGSGEFPLVAEQLAIILKSPGGVCPLQEGTVAPPETSPDLRSIVCLGLNTLVDSFINLDKKKEDYDVYIQNQIASGMETLVSSSTGFMALLCNNYTSPDLKVIEKLVQQVLELHKIKKGGEEISPAGLAASAKNVVLQTVHEKGNQKCELAVKAFLRIADQEV